MATDVAGSPGDENFHFAGRLVSLAHFDVFKIVNSRMP